MDKLWDNLGWILFVVFVFGGWVITSTVGTLAANWRKVRESEHLAALKQSMVERGMSAEDIERVVNAGRKLPKPSEEPAEEAV